MIEGVDETAMDNIADDFGDMGFEDEAANMPPPPPPENEARKQHLRNLINKAKSGRLNKYFGTVNTSVDGPARNV